MSNDEAISGTPQDVIGRIRAAEPAETARSGFAEAAARADARTWGAVGVDQGHVFAKIAAVSDIADRREASVRSRKWADGGDALAEFFPEPVGSEAARSAMIAADDSALSGLG